jgi:uncharacterized protein YecT (DUF1311 family)
MNRLFALAALAFVIVVPSFSLAQTDVARAGLAWVLGYRGHPAGDVLSDKRTSSLIRARIPANLSGRLLDSLGGPPDSVVVVDQRFVSVSACAPRFCLIKGLFWVDIARGVELGAVFDGDQETLTLGSNAFSGKALPSEGKKALLAWMSSKALRPTKSEENHRGPLDDDPTWFKSIQFVDAKNEITDLNPFDFAPKVGPSYDCAKASTAIERRICSDWELSELDFDLSRLYLRIRDGFINAIAHEQLISMQRDWLKTRDTECTKAADLRSCLLTKYRERTQELRDWSKR